MNEDLKKREQLSALMDSQLQGDEWLQALECAEHQEGRATWHAYHLVGDVLRSTELANGTSSSSDFLSRFQERMALEPCPAVASSLPEAPVQPAVHGLGKLQDAANASVFRWKMLAGFASLAVVASVGWNSWEKLQTGSAPEGTQLAVAVPAVAPSTALTTKTASSVPSLMIRDPRLDELLAAHQQFGGTTALQMPAGFLRNATFEAPSR